MSFIKINFEEEIKKLKPVTWVYNNDPTETVQIGYIAEDLDKVDALKFLVQYDNNKQAIGIKYEILSVYAIEALKSAFDKIAELENKINNLNI